MLLQVWGKIVPTGIVPAGPTSPLSPLGNTRFSFWSGYEPVIVALASSPFSTVPIANSFGGPCIPCIPWSPLGITKSNIASVDVPTFTTLAWLPASPVVTVPIDSSPVSPLSPFSPCIPCTP